MRCPEVLASSCPWGWECVGGFAQGEVPFGEGDLTLGRSRGDNELHNFSMALSLLLTEITKIWDCVSECYHQDLLLKKVGLVSSWSSLRPWGIPDPSPSCLALTQPRRQKRCSRQTLHFSQRPIVSAGKKSKQCLSRRMLDFLFGVLHRMAGKEGHPESAPALLGLSQVPGVSPTSCTLQILERRE